MHLLDGVGEVDTVLVHSGVEDFGSSRGVTAHQLGEGGDMLAHRLEGYGTLGQLGGELPEDELVGLHRPRSIDAEGFGRLSGIALYLSQSFARDPHDGLKVGHRGIEGNTPLPDGREGFCCPCDPIAKYIHLPSEPHEAVDPVLGFLHLGGKLACSSVHLLKPDGKVAVDAEEIIEGGRIHREWLS